ncbi:FUSC family protein [Microbulbifer agarilyticus]|uniref:FUSC family protein n=1 Tax=Microbulbifer agarilyticus TaxID=260552 RepID=UPI001CD2FDB9|nr:FUSC family protein [Microbulbifer agarilyticus]MCA0899439.1 FUSC family protein [Microbulbifer agarilyticus]
MVTTTISNALRSAATREAVKTALALVLTYWIALQANWEKPMWAGLAVAVVSLSSLGLSLNKGAMRILGTLVAAIAALVLVGLFPQDRWLFMTALSLWVGCCAYLMLGSTRGYFWQVCGFSSVIICVGAATSHDSAFDTAVLRAQQTGLGVLIYSLVAMLLWPCRSADDFRDAVAALHQKQRALYQKIVVERHGPANMAKTRAQLGDLAAAHRSLDSLLNAAIADSYDIWEVRAEWQQYVAHCKTLTECLEQLALLAPGRTLQQIQALIPSQPDFDQSMQRRFDVLATPPDSGHVASVEKTFALGVEKSGRDSLSLYDAGNLAMIRRQFIQLDTLSRALLSLRADINGHRSVALSAGDVTALEGNDKPRSVASHWTLDRDRLIATLRVIGSLWAAYLIYIYVEGVPAGPTLVTLTGVFALVMATAPHVPPRRLLVPVLLAILLAAPIYLLVMPKLHAFWQLGLLLFGFSFVLCRLFASPEARGVRVLILCVFIAVTSIQNAQTYSFMSVVSIAMVFVLVLLLLSLAAYIPTSPRPEQVFRRHLRHFFLSAGHFARVGGRPKDRLSEDWRENSLSQSLTTLPVKISESASRVPARLLPDESRDALHSLVERVGALAFFMLSLASQSPASCAESDILQRWRESVAHALSAMAASLNGSRGKLVDYQALSMRLQQLLDDMESTVRSDVAQRGVPSADEIEQWLCRAGLLRGIGQTLVEMCRVTDEINWSLWDEQYFFE